MADENPPLGKSFIAGFSANNLAYPILAVKKDARSSPTPPTVGTATGLSPEHVVAFPTNFFTRVENLSEERVLWLYEILPGPSLPGRVMSDQAQGAVVGTTKQILAIGDSAYSPDWKTLSYSDTPIDAVRKERNVVTMPDSVFPILTDYDQDPEMQSLITTTFQVVQASAVSAPTAVSGVITRYRHIDKWRSLKIVETYATPANYSEQKFSGQNFPNLFSAFYHDEDCGTNLIQRSSFSAMVEIRLDVSFGSYALVSGLTLIPNTFAFGSFRVSDILNDAATLNSSGACTYTLPLPASSPTKSTYQAYGSTKQLVSGECVLWKAGIFRTTALYVRML